MGQCYITRRGLKEVGTLAQLGVYPTGLDGRPTGNVTVIDGTITLSEYLFKNNDSVTGVALPESLVSLNNNAFQNCINLQQIVLPDDIENIPDYCFDGCTNLLKIVFPKSLKSIGTYAFQNCTDLIVVNIDDEIGSLLVNSYAFSGCSNLSNDIITKIGTRIDGTIYEYAFANLNKITDVKTNYVYNYYFYNCTNLQKVEILKALNSGSCGGAYVFNGCTNLKEVVLPNKATIIPANMFNGNTTLRTVNMPTSLVTIEANAFYNCNNLDGELVFPETLTTIGDSAFSGCYRLNIKDGYLPPSLYIITTNTFLNAKGTNFNTPILNVNSDNTVLFYNYACKNAGFKEINFNGNGDIKVNLESFRNCDLEKINFKNEESKIRFITNVNSWNSTAQSSYVFAGTKLTNDMPNYILSKIALENTSQVLPNHLFHACQTLTDITIPCLACGYEFADCSNLEKVTFRDVTEDEIDLKYVRKQIGEYSLAACSKLKEVNFSKDITHIYAYAFQASSALRDVNINPDGVNLTIVTNAFDNASGPRKLIFPTNVKTFQDYSMPGHSSNNYSNLKEFFVMNPTATFGSNAFYMRYINVTPTCYYTGTKPSGTSYPPKYILVERVGENICWWMTNTSEINFEGIGATLDYTDDFNVILEELNTTLETPKTEADFTISIVTVLPTESFDETLIYRIKNSDKTMYTDYVAVNGELKQIRTVPTFDKDLITKITIREGRITSLGANLFKGCSAVTEVVIPATVTFIGENVFADCPEDMVIFCNRNSTAHIYAETNGIKFLCYEDQLNEHYDFENLPTFVDATNYSIDTANKALKWSTSNGTIQDYISFTTGPYKESISISAFAGGENNYDFGAINVATVERTFTNAEIRNGTAVTGCSWLMRQTGTGSVSFKTYTKDLEPNTTYYVYFCYATDNSGTGGVQSLLVQNIDRYYWTE